MLWIKDDSIRFAFEVESTTSMTSALQRGSNIDKTVSKIMLFPHARFRQFERKMKSPLFSESFENDNWKFILFKELYNAWNNSKSNVVLDEITNINIVNNKTQKKDNNQLHLEIS